MYLKTHYKQPTLENNNRYNTHVFNSLIAKKQTEHQVVSDRDQPKFSFGYGAETGDIFSFGYRRNCEARFGLLLVTAETTTKFRREPKLSLLVIR